MKPHSTNGFRGSESTIDARWLQRSRPCCFATRDSLYTLVLEYLAYCLAKHFTSPSLATQKCHGIVHTGSFLRCPCE